MKKQWMVVLGVSAMLFGCPDNGGGGTGGGNGGTGGGAGGGGGNSGFQQPAGTVAVNFTVDDSANKVFAQGDLEWKGGFKVDSTTRILTASGWDGPFAKLYDDGPWTSGGHEPKTATASDHKWGITAFVAPPNDGGTDEYQYGLQDATTQGWIWPLKDNGSFKVASGATAEINATPVKFDPFGTTDLKLVLDKNGLVARPPLSDGGTPTWDTSLIKVKGSGWSWSEVTLADDGKDGDDTAGDNKYTFILSNVVGAGKKYPHSGLGTTGDKIEFIFVLGPDAEYRDSTKNGATMGVTAYTKAAGGSWTAANIQILTAKTNTYVQIP